MKTISSHESPESPQPPPTPGRAHIDDIVESGWEEIRPQPSEGSADIEFEDPAMPGGGVPQLSSSDVEFEQALDLSAGFVPKWTVIAEEDIVQPHPDLFAETVLLVSVLADNSLLDLLSALVADCFYATSNQVIFTAMNALRLRGVGISQSTLESECAGTGKSDALPVLKRMSALLPELAVDRPTFYRYIGIVRDQCVIRGLRWCLQTIIDSSYRGCSPADLISRAQLALADLNDNYVYLSRNATIERQESGYVNEAEIVAATRCTRGNFDS